MLGITSDPLPMPLEMFTVIGEIVILWSRIETSIDTDLETMKQWPVVAQMVPNGVRGFSKKLEHWRRAVKTLYPKVEVYQGHAAEFERAAKMVAKLRNHLIHGTWSMEATECGGFVVTNVRRDKGGDKFEQFEITMEVLLALLDDMRSLDNYIVGFIGSRMLHAHLGLLKADHEPSP